MKVIELEIAALTVKIELDEELNSLLLPRSYSPFLKDHKDHKVPKDPIVLRVKAGSAPFSPAGLSPVATGINDLGEARLYEKQGIYVVALSPISGSEFRLMRLDPDFCGATLWLSPSDSYTSFVLDSMLRILFAQAAVSHDTLLVHASTVIREGRAYLFMGKSGTGKSTHSSLWIKTFGDVTLLNDDNPAIRLMADGTVRAYGTPWSGKTPCWRQLSAPLQGIARLEQAPENEFIILSDIDAFMAILPGVSVITSRRRLYNRAASIVEELTRRLRIGRLRCLPDAAAARLSRSALAEPVLSATTEN